MTLKEKKRAKHRRWQLRYPEKAYANTKKWDFDHRDSIDHWVAKRVRHIKCRSRRLGIEFDLTKEHLRSVFPDTRLCPTLGIPLHLYGPIRQGTASVDRIVPALGYVDGNVQILSMAANTAKGG
jgi:hypothetical protein